MTMDINAALRDERDRCLNRARLLSQLIGDEPAASMKRVVSSAVTPAERQERVSKEAIEKALGRIEKALETSSIPEKLREALGMPTNQNASMSEHLRESLNMPKKLFQYAAALGKDTGRVVVFGEKRQTVYSLPGPRETDIDASKMLEHIETAHPKGSKAQQEGRVVKKKRR